MDLIRESFLVLHHFYFPRLFHRRHRPPHHPELILVPITMLFMIDYFYMPLQHFEKFLSIILLVFLFFIVCPQFKLVVILTFMARPARLVTWSTLSAFPRLDPNFLPRLIHKFLALAFFVIDQLVARLFIIRPPVV